MIELNQRAALIVGPENAITAAIAGALAAAGASVRAAVPASSASSGSTAMRLDDSSQETIHRDLAALGPVDIAVVAPGWYDEHLFMQTTPADWEAAFGQNFESAVYIAQALARPMIDAGRGGRIILLSTVTAMMPFIQQSAYGASLAALRALAKMIAVELGPYQITVNVVAPGWVESETSAPYLTPDGRTYVEAGIPLGRVGQPEDVANVCLFLASELAAYVTGALIPVDGGYILTQSDGETMFPPGTA